MAAVGIKWRLCVLCLLGLSINVYKVRASQEVVKKLTIGFLKTLNQCQKEMNLPDHMMQDFFNFWKEDYDLLNRDVGCTIMCMASKFDMITDDMKLHHGNAHEFAKAHGADDNMAKQLVTFIHDCENTHSSIQDDCVKVLEIAKCFRTKIHGLKWAPTMEEVLEEVMIEFKA